MIDGMETLELAMGTTALALHNLAWLLHKDGFFKQFELRVLIAASVLSSSAVEGDATDLPDICLWAKAEISKVTKVERLILSTFDYKICSPTPVDFIRLIVRDNIHLEEIALYLFKLLLPYKELLKFPPSVVGSSLVLFGRFLMDSIAHPWVEESKTITGCTAIELMECVYTIMHLFCDCQKDGGCLRLERRVLVKDEIVRNLQHYFDP